MIWRTILENLIPALGEDSFESELVGPAGEVVIV